MPEEMNDGINIRLYWPQEHMCLSLDSSFLFFLQFCHLCCPPILSYFHEDLLSTSYQMIDHVTPLFKSISFVFGMKTQFLAWASERRGLQSGCSDPAASSGARLVFCLLKCTLALTSHSFCMGFSICLECSSPEQLL